LIHIWQRELYLPGTRGFEPGSTELVESLVGKIETMAQSRGRKITVNRRARVNEVVFDITLVQPNEWWFGYHVAGTPSARWPGGVPMLAGGEFISRAYLKLYEALLWSGIHINPDDVCAEIGSAPGGACQLLLEKGAKVIAIDPAEMDESIANHKNLKHLRCRGHEVKKRELKDVRWLIADLNVAPSHALDTIENIATNRHLGRLMGMILTLKLADWKLADEIPDWIQRVKSFGFQLVKTRQLAFNRREICMVAVRDKFALRANRKK
jgi:23S rRNA (cytidine2498-2'-O)-methyltransferase